jgi:hypothetical protein
VSACGGHGSSPELRRRQDYEPMPYGAVWWAKMRWRVIKVVVWVRR